MISIVIINFNTFNLTVECIRSVQLYTKGEAYEIILVDNCSTERDPEDFRNLFSDIKLVKNNANTGFAKGNNAGIAHATGEVILLLNSDTYLEEDSISKASSFLATRPDIGVLGVSLKYGDGRVQHYTRRFRNITNELLDLVRPLLYVLPYRKRAMMMLNQYYNGDFDVEADWIGGAFFMFPKPILERLPGERLDERYFMYGEDQLWCYQIGLLGYKCYNYSGTSVVHIEGGSGKERRPRFNKDHLERDIAIYKMKGGGWLKYNVLKAIYFTKKYIAYVIKSLRYTMRRG